MNGEAKQFSNDSFVQQYHALLKVSEAIVAHKDLASLFRDLSEKLPLITPYDFIGVLLHDGERQVMRLHSLTTPAPLDVQVLSEVSVDTSPSGFVWRTQEPLFIDVEQETRFQYIIELLRSQHMKVLYLTPLTSANRRLGAMGFGSREVSAFSESGLSFLNQVARQVAVAVDNVLNFEKARVAEQALTRERNRLRLLLDISNRLTSRLNLHELLQAVSSCLHEVLHHTAAVLLLYDAESNQLRTHALQAPRSSLEEGALVPISTDNPTGLAFVRRQPILVNKLDLNEFPDAIVKTSYDDGIRAGCNVPLISQDRVLGVLVVVSNREYAFDEADLELLTQIANQFAIAVENALAYREIEVLKNKLTEEKLYLEEEIQTVFNFEEIIGQSVALKRILKQIETVAPTDSTILIQGETGTGKELIARAIHKLSLRQAHTLVKLNCAAIPTGLLESELFGHEKGAFTGAIAQRIGRFELAHRGTLFLDEVGDIPLELQPKLLRVLQEQEFERLGSARTIKVNTRLVAATNCDLAQMVSEKKYRSDLYYRLNVFPILIPPLRERPQDITLLARFFAQKFARGMKKRIETIPLAVQEALLRYRWPGNVRELENLIERAVILTKGSELEINLNDLPANIEAESHSGSISTLETAERQHILRALQECQWVIGGATGAAARLGMKRTTLQSRMQKLGITRSN
jgi:formate hydrogenlyase transcriptional activator